MSRRHPDRIRRVFKHAPAPEHPRAMAAAVAAEAAGRQGRFWEMHDRLFEHQTHLDDETVIAIVRELALDPEQFTRDCADPRLARRVARERAHAAKLGVAAPPAVFVNGRYIDPASLSAERLAAVVDEQLASAQQLLARGVPRGRLYDRLTGPGKAAA